MVHLFPDEINDRVSDGKFDALGGKFVCRELLGKILDETKRHDLVLNTVSSQMLLVLDLLDQEVHFLLWLNAGNS